mmetsp:Transcript_11754/g.33770  ORF Transcript_11754/g.33770 Transcript_11754/m.33770 type:complete len:163 (+) Transcript_11754:1384-1872(+)
MCVLVYQLVTSCWVQIRYMRSMAMTVFQRRTTELVLRSVGKVHPDVSLFQTRDILFDSNTIAVYNLQTLSYEIKLRWCHLLSFLHFRLQSLQFRLPPQQIPAIERAPFDHACVDIEPDLFVRPMVQRDQRHTRNGEDEYKERTRKHTRSSSSRLPCHSDSGL